MKTSEYFCATQKEVPHEVVAISHRLMIRAGLIRPVAAGIYAWMPTGQRVLKKLKNIIRQHMSKVGALEISLPCLQPRQLWETSKRLSGYGSELFQLRDRRHAPLVLGATHEEVLTSLLQPLLQSTKQLPLTFFQISQKFRDEKRPRFGAIRGREFIMKDAYSFHDDLHSLQDTYIKMQAVYGEIFRTIGLKVIMVKADTGSIGGDCSHEFHALSDSGEDRLLLSENEDYAANVEIAEAFVDPPSPIEEVTLLAVQAESSSPFPCIFLAIRRMDTINSTRLSHITDIAMPLKCFESPAAHLETVTHGVRKIFKLPGPLIRDQWVARADQFKLIAGDTHWEGISWNQFETEIKDFPFRQVQAGDRAPNGLSQLKEKTGIEVGHLFQLKDRYSACFKLNCFHPEHQIQKCILMGCYGLGVSRIIAAFIEQNHDQKGIKWSKAIAPFEVGLLVLPSRDNGKLYTYVEQLYDDLMVQGVEVLWENRAGQTGFLLSEIELVGIPYTLIFSNRLFELGQVEFRTRIAGEEDTQTIWPLSQIPLFLKEKIASMPAPLF